MILVIVALAIVGGGVYYLKTKNQTSVNSILSLSSQSNTQSNKCEPERKKFWLAIDNLHTVVVNKSDVSCTAAAHGNSDFLFELISMGKSQDDLLGYLKNNKFAIESYKRDEEQRIAVIKNTKVSELSQKLQNFADKIHDDTDRKYAEQVIANIQQLLPLLVEYHQNCSALYDKVQERIDLDFQLVRKEITREKYDQLVKQKNGEVDAFIASNVKPVEIHAWALKNTLWGVQDKLLPSLESRAQQAKTHVDPYSTPLGPLLREFEKIPLYRGMVEDKSAAADVTGEACTFQDPEVFRYMKSDAVPTQVAAFYNQQLPKLGWGKEQDPYYTWRWKKDSFEFVITPPNRQMNDLVNKYLFTLSPMGGE